MLIVYLKASKQRKIKKKHHFQYKSLKEKI